MTNALTREGTDRPGSELGRFLLSNGSMSPDWVASFNAVSRALFVPDVAWKWDEDQGRSVAIDRNVDQAAWFDAVNSNVPLVTQWDDGAHQGDDPGHTSTSSTSQPNVVMSMLQTLDVRPGMRVYEGGTGTGWNCGLLAHRLGARQVVSVEYDAIVADQARRNLARAGLTPDVIAGDAQLGWPKGGPYDRFIATYGVRSIPSAWIRQAQTGAVIVAPYGTEYSHRDAVVKLTVHDDDTVSGPFTELVGFMKDRGSRRPFPEHAAYVPEFPGSADTSYVTTRTADDLGGSWDVRGFYLGLAVPDVTHVIHHQDDDTTTAWFYGLKDRSWAAVVWRKDQPATTVYQAGPRRLWQAVERALGWWEDQSRPGVERFGLTVDLGEHIPWLDNPENPVPRQM
ncbi:protein-L-isoaspartate(D-aspartate) O-methyltransferase [Kitasatospora sp. NPDC001574]